MSPCPARPGLRLQFLMKVAECFRLVSPLTVRTDAAAASTELQHRPFLYQPRPFQPNPGLSVTLWPHPPLFPTRTASFHIPIFLALHSSRLFGATCSPAHTDLIGSCKPLTTGHWFIISTGQRPLRVRWRKF